MQLVDIKLIQFKNSLQPTVSRELCWIYVIILTAILNVETNMVLI